METPKGRNARPKLSAQMKFLIGAIVGAMLMALALILPAILSGPTPQFSVKSPCPFCRTNQ